MNSQQITMTKNEAQQAFLSYRQAVKDRHSSEYTALMKGYKALAKGQALLDLYDVLQQAGVDRAHRPRLAIANASAKTVRFRGAQDGSGVFDTEGNFYRDAKRRTVRFPKGTLPINTMDWWNQPDSKAVVPLVPAALLPKAALQNYHILWEAEWETVPRDPLLLRHLAGSLYAVLASWNLTPLERAVLKGRLIH